MNTSIFSAFAVLLLVTLAPLGAVAGPLDTGELVDSMAFTDIEGTSASTGDYSDRVQVWTIGNRRSSGRLTEWMGSVGLRSMTDRPDLRFAFLNFADVQVVPELFQPMTLSIMRHINEGAKEDLRRAYAERGIDLTPERARIHLTADWDGDFLKAFGIADAKQYHCWIVQGGRVVAHFAEGTPDIAARFAAVIASLVTGPASSADNKAGAKVKAGP